MLTDIVVEITVMALLLSLAVQIHKRHVLLIRPAVKDFRMKEMLPFAPVILPLFAAALLAALTKMIPQRVSQLIAVGTAFATLGDCFYLM